MNPPVGEPVPATKLAELHDVSASYLAKQLQALSRAGRPKVVRKPLGSSTPESGSAAARVPAGTPGIFETEPVTR